MMDFVAGSIAGATGQLVGHPLDSIKTRLQSESLLSRGSTNTSNTTTSALKCARNIFNEGGIRAFFRGLSLPLCSKSFEQSVAFGIQSGVDQLLEGIGVNEGTLRTGVSGMAAGSTTALLLTPIYLVKVQLQVTPKTSLSGPISVIKSTINKIGFFGLYTGAVPIFIGTSIGYGCRFMAYDKATQVAEKSFGLGKVGSVVVGGGVAGMATWASHYPLDLISSRMEASVAFDGGQQLTMTGHIKEIYRQSGVKGFFRGIGPCLLRAFPVNATIFLTYELCKSNLT